MASARYIYAIVRSGSSHLPHTLTGLNGESLTLIQWQALAAVTSMTADSRVQPRAALLVRHAAVVEVICQYMPALPVRFGAVLPNATAVASMLEERYDLLLADLTRIGGKQELGVTVLWDSAENSSAETLTDTDTSYRHIAGIEYHHADEQGQGTRYLLARKEAYQHDQATRERAQAVIADLEKSLGPYVCESRCEIHMRPRINIRAAYLLAPEMVFRARDTLARYQEQRQDLRLLVTGPWPPYSFISAPGEPGPETVERLVHGDGSVLGAL